MREYLTKTTELKAVFGEWPIYHRYTHGVAGERFFRELADQGRVVASTCPQCKRAFVPPSMYCEDCFAEMKEYRPVGDTGAVDSFTILHESLDETTLPEPLVIALVRFEGVKGGLLAPVKGVAPDQMRIGMKVKTVIDKKKPTYSLRDLSFKPA